MWSLLMTTCLVGIAPNDKPGNLQGSLLDPNGQPLSGYIIPSLGGLCRKSSTIVVYRVAKQTKSAQWELKSHRVIHGRKPAILQLTLQSAAPFQCEVFRQWATKPRDFLVFHLPDGKSLGYLDRGWFLLSLNPLSGLNSAYRLEQMSHQYAGSVSTLQRCIKDILAGKKVIVPAIVPEKKNLWQKLRTIDQQDWLHGRRSEIHWIEVGPPPLKKRTILEQIRSKYDPPPIHVRPAPMKLKQRIRHLTSQLKSKDPDHRAAALDDLRHYGVNARSAIPTLRILLKDPNGFIRIYAMQALRAIDPNAKLNIEPLRVGLKSDNDLLRHAALSVTSSLRNNAEPLIPDLLGNLKGKDVFGKCSACFVLADLAKSHSDAGVREKIITAMGIAIQKEEYSHARLQMVQAFLPLGAHLWRITPSLSAILDEGGGTETEAVADILTRLEPGAKGILGRTLFDSGELPFGVSASQITIHGFHAMPHDTILDPWSYRRALSRNTVRTVRFDLLAGLYRLQPERGASGYLNDWKTLFKDPDMDLEHIGELTAGKVPPELVPTLRQILNDSEQTTYLRMVAAHLLCRTLHRKAALDWLRSLVRNKISVKIVPKAAPIPDLSTKVWVRSAVVGTVWGWGPEQKPLWQDLLKLFKNELDSGDPDPELLLGLHRINPEVTIAGFPPSRLKLLSKVWDLCERYLLLEGQARLDGIGILTDAISRKPIPVHQLQDRCKNGNHGERLAAAALLHFRGEKPETVLLTLNEILRRRPELIPYCGRVIQGLGSKARPLVPSLQRALSSPFPEVYREARTALRSVAPDAKTLWSIGSLPRQSGVNLQVAWEDLASLQPKTGYPAQCRLILADARVEDFIEKHLTPVPVIPRHQITHWLDKLTSKRYIERESATKNLLSYVQQATPELKARLKANPTLEMRKRLEQILKQLDPLDSPHRIRAIRAVTVLEHRGTAKARKVLGALAKGAAGADLTRASKLALKRLR